MVASTKSSLHGTIFFVLQKCQDQLIVGSNLKIARIIVLGLSCQLFDRWCLWKEVGQDFEKLRQLMLLPYDAEAP